MRADESAASVSSDASRRICNVSNKFDLFYLTMQHHCLWLIFQARCHRVNKVEHVLIHGVHFAVTVKLVIQGRAVNRKSTNAYRLPV
jgi:hypothetical protein